MLIALRERSAGSVAGQTSTHKLQPVQSSRYTCNEYCVSGNPLALIGADLNIFRCFLQMIFVIKLSPDHTMRTYISTVTALYTGIRFPNRNQVRNISFFPLRSAAGISSINWSFYLPANHRHDQPSLLL